jgi:peptide/nickel transport system permease protein
MLWFIYLAKLRTDLLDNRSLAILLETYKLLICYTLVFGQPLSIATAIIVEASLSFLGLGTQPPTPSWGWDLKANVSWIQMHPWLALAPGCAIFITVLGFNLFGDGLRDALDPRLK